MHLVYRNHTIRHDMLRHFYGGGPKEAIKFTNIWIPYNCSYHRFTNVTVDKCVTYLLRRINHENVDINDHQHTNNVSDQYADHHHQQQHTNTSYNHNHDHDHNHDNCDIRSTNIHHLDSLRNNSMDSADSHNVDNNSLNGYNRVFNISSNHHNHNQHLHDYNNNELNYNQYDYNISNHHNYSHKIINNHYNHHRLKIRKKLRIVFFGDSATRGIINGITRILSGSEIFGPCVSDICGRPGASPPSEREHNQHKIYTYHQLIITFIYTKSLTIPYTLQHIESILKENKTYALILNTGAWDFDHVSRAYKNNTALDECGKQAMHEVSKLRTSSIINESMWRFSELAAKYHTRIIYRNNHFNRRFGTICADAEFESMIYGSNWEIWNNREISRDSWVEVCYNIDSFNDVKYHIVCVHIQTYEYIIYLCMYILLYNSYVRYILLAVRLFPE